MLGLRIPSLSSFLRPWDLQVDLGLEAEARSLIERVGPRSWCWTGRAGMLQLMGSQRVRHD